MRQRCVLSAWTLTAIMVLATGRSAAAAQEWPPVTDEEKAMKDLPQQPGTPAVFLYREEITNHNTGTTTHYCRLKILSSAGKERANIEIPVLKGYYKMADLKARVVRPNGASVEFAGKVFEKTALRAGKLKVTVETFALPDVDVGSIIDYRYKTVPDEGGSSSKKGQEVLETLLGPQGKPREGGIDTEEGIFFLPVQNWDVQEDLFTRKAKFAYEPSDDLERVLSRLSHKGMRLNWVTHGLVGLKPERKKGRLELELENIPPFDTEEYMPPESTQQMMVRLFYLEGSMSTPDEYWKEESKNWQKGAEKFMRKAGDAAAEAQKLVAGVDDPLMKLRKLYGRAQQIKNLSYDKTLTSQRRKELQIKDNRSVADVFKNNYGLRSDITRTFVALASAAGFEARVVRAATRDDKYFDRNLCGLYSQFDSELAKVRVNGRELLFDPGTPYCPLGLIRWNCTETTCLAPSDKPPAFLMTPAYPPATAQTQREIALQLDLEGNLAGTAKVTFVGQEGLALRLEHIGDDELEVKKDLEADMVKILPDGAKVTLQKVENISNNADEVIARFEISLPGLATQAGQRTLLPASPLLGGKQYPFRHAQRKYPVCFQYPHRVFDDIVITLPARAEVYTTPMPRSLRGDFFEYTLNCAVAGAAKLHIQRDLVVKKTSFKADQYGIIRSFFDQVRAGDEEQFVLSLNKK
jgi:hypothetical protein